MTIMENIFYIIALFGISLAITKEEIFSSLRQLIKKKSKSNRFMSKIDYLFNCPKCMGFWVGISISLLVYLSPLKGNLGFMKIYNIWHALLYGPLMIAIGHFYIIFYDLAYALVDREEHYASFVKTYREKSKKKGCKDCNNK